MLCYTITGCLHDISSWPNEQITLAIKAIVLHQLFLRTFPDTTNNLHKAAAAKSFDLRSHPLLVRMAGELNELHRRNGARSSSWFALNQPMC
jgi:hypothetical protein